MALSSPATTTFTLPSSPPGPPSVGIVPANKTPITLSDFDLPLHYTLRAFRASVKALPLTLVDLDYHSVEYWEELTVAEMDTVDARIVGDEDWTTYGLTMDDLNLLTQNQLDVLTQRQIESSAGIGDVVAWNYSPGMNITVPTTGRTISSKFDDDLTVAPFDDPEQVYYIELVLRDFPSAASSPRLNINTSYIAFSSDSNLDSAVTDIVYFNESSEDLSAGGNLVWRVERSRLVNADIANLKRIDFYLESIDGNVNFKAEAMRLIPTSYPYYSIGIDTKSGILVKNPSENGTNISPQPTAPPVMNIGSNKAKNFTEVIRFNTGHAPADPLYNQFSVFLRANEGNGEYIEVVGKFNQDKTIVQVFEGGVGVRQVTVEETLVDNTDHLMVIDLVDGVIRVVIWELRGHYPTEVRLNSEDIGIIPIGRLEPGWVAFDFAPYNGDFYINYMFARDAALAELESKTFQSLTPVRGVTLYANNSGSIQLLNDLTPIEEGPAVNIIDLLTMDSGADNGDFLITPGVNDVSISLDTTVTNGSEASYKVRKHVRNAFMGGIQWDSIIKINDPLNAFISGDLKFDTKLNYGAFRIVLFDKFWENVAFVHLIDASNLVLNKWNSFRVPILNEEIYQNEFRMQIQHVGINLDYETDDTEAVGTFWLDNVKVETQSVVWEASNDDGLTYLRFFDTVGNQYEGVNFPQFNNQLKIRAKAFTTKAWVNSYEAIVHYAQPGRILE